MTRNLVFISYSHDDRNWLERLQKHLTPYIRAARLSVWDDTQIPTGGKWPEHISAALASARVGVLLVSHNFLDSDFIADQQLPLLLEAANSGDLVIVWVPLSHSSFHVTAINEFRPAWDPCRPLASLSESEQEQALVEICEAIEHAFNVPHELMPPIGVGLAPQLAPAVAATSAARRGVDHAVRRTPRELTPAEIANGFRKLSFSLLDLRVPADQWIPRSEEEQIRSLLAETGTKCVCLLGGPGSGKTALLAKLGDELGQAGNVVVAIKADRISTDLSSWVRSQLDLNISIIDGIVAASSLSTVVVVIDQLDALASMADLHPKRLNDLLDLIRQCQDIPNVTVVCSCRELEYRRDTRLNHLNLESVTLELPSWEQVSCELKKAGIQEPELWPECFRQVLRTPQHLRIYLDRFRATGQTDAFDTYQQMLDDLWKRRIHSEKRRHFIDRLTTDLMKRESLWAPAVLFEDDEGIVEELEREDVLQRHDLQIGFRHQTLLEHAKARLFTKSGESLADYLLRRQNAVFVRPTIWSVLRYLRGADRGKYRREIETLMRADLRLHVRLLLIDFLGQVANPDDFEVVLLAERLAIPDERRRVLLAIRGSERWFQALRSTHFPTVMRWEVTDAWPMIGVIEEAWRFAHDDCFRLIEEYWLVDTARDELTWRALHEIDRWDQRSVDVIRRLIRRAKKEHIWWAVDMVYLISADQPQLAPQVVAEVLEKQLDEATTKTQGSCPDEELSFQMPRSTHSPLDLSGDWHELPAVAEAAPTEFLRSTWSWFTRVAVEFHSGCPSSVVQEFGGWIRAFDQAESGRHRPLASSILMAVEETASSDPQAFLEITRSSWEIENRPIQSLLACGLAKAAADLPKAALDFLCSDPRRLHLGTYDAGEQADSVALIKAVGPHLDEPGLRRLESTILSWSLFRPDVELEQMDELPEREARLRLLKAIPERFLTPTTVAFVRREETEIRDWDWEPFRAGRPAMVKEVPPLTKEQMIRTSDEQILDALAADPDGERSGRQWDEHEGVWLRPGGARAVARELAELAKEQPEHVLPLLPKLIAVGNESPAADIMRSLESSHLTDERVYQLVRELAALGAESEEFRSGTAYLLYRRCKEKTGLPDDIRAIVERWLAMPWDSSYGISRSNDLEEPDETGELVSVLWAPRGGLLDTDRSFWPLLAVTNGCLMRLPPDTDRWLDALEQQLDRDIAERTWIAYCSELRWIGLEGCNRERGVAVIRKLFHRFPSLKTGPEGIRLVASLAYLLPDNFLQRYLDDLSLSSSPQARVGFGELLTMVALGEVPREWAVPLLEQQIKAYDGANAIAAEPVAVGIAHAAAHGWDEPDARPQATRLLCQLIPKAAGPVIDAIGTVFWAKEDFPADDQTELLLQTLADHPNALGGRNVTDLLAHLVKLVPHQPHIVLAVCRAIVERRGTELTSISYGLFSAGPHLVNIAMTLQRFEDTKSDGLDLLESLLRLGIDDAFAILREVDIRPASGRRREPRKRRRRKGA